VEWDCRWREGLVRRGAGEEGGRGRLEGKAGVGTVGDEDGDGDWYRTREWQREIEFVY